MKTGLYIEDMEFERGFVRVQRSLTYGTEGPTKSRAGRRTVYLDSETLTMLKQFIGERTTGRVFQSKHGRWMDMHEVSRHVLAPLCKRLGIEPGGLHSFRHGRVSLLQANRLPADFIKNQVGHSSLKTTSGYTHFSEAQMQHMAEELRSKAELWSNAN